MRGWILAIPFIKNLLPIQTEPIININAYLGNWYQVATSRSTALLGTGIDYYNVQAEYGLCSKGISVFNSGYQSNGNYTYIEGYSYVEGDKETKRKLHFEGVPVDGNYWIVKLGPIKDNEYQYAIVSGALTTKIGTRFSLYVLARNRTDYANLYEGLVTQWCKDNGFVLYWNKYIGTN